MAVTTQTSTETGEPGEGPAVDGSAQRYDDAEPATSEDDRRPTRLGRGWAIGISAALVLSAVGVGVAGFFALRSHDDSVTLARNEVTALAQAKDCVAATHAPDAAAMSASQAKILECSTGDFAVQAGIYGGMLVDAYRAANVQVEVSDIRAAVEKHNDDGSIDVLVAVRTKVTNTEVADQEQGYRLRVQMAPADGTYKVAELDTVAS